MLLKDCFLNSLNPKPTCCGWPLATLVGRRLMYNWPGHGWCEGQIKERNTKKGLKIDGDVVNFLVHYPVDDDTSRHVLSLDTYASDECAPPNSWFLLEEL